MCVRKLASQMLITITNSNSTPEVNSSEVSLKLQWEFCVCTQKHSIKSSFGRRGLRDLGTFAHMCLYTNSFIIAMIIQITNFLLCVRSIILKKNCNHHYNDDSSYKFSLVCNCSLSSCVHACMHGTIKSLGILLLKVCKNASLFVFHMQACKHSVIKLFLQLNNVNNTFPAEFIPKIILASGCPKKLK